MGSGVIQHALLGGLLDELTIHQIPILLDGGREMTFDRPGFECWPTRWRDTS